MSREDELRRERWERMTPEQREWDMIDDVLCKLKRCPCILCGLELGTCIHTGNRAIQLREPVEFIPITGKTLDEPTRRPCDFAIPADLFAVIGVDHAPGPDQTVTYRLDEEGHPVDVEVVPAKGK